MRNSLCALTLILCFPALLFSQTSVSGIINQYTPVVGVDTCAMTLTVQQTQFFKKNDRVILYQAGGASMASSNDDRFGDVSDFRMAGKYEVNEIDSVATGVLYMRFKFKNVFELSGGLQVVSFPKYDNLTVTDTLKARAWDGKTGGILAFEANTLTLNAPIDATGVGFRGGIVKRCPDCRGGVAGIGAKNYNEFFYDFNTTDADDCGGQKGEGVSPYIGGKDAGRGAQANGGGGGNNHKAGAGGGANIGAGGQGGFQENGSCNGRNPGLGGKSLTLRGLERFFLGGGGGCGHNKDLADSRGGAGGGGIFIKVGTLNGNNQLVRANGSNAANINGDGAGGGGAGGFVAIIATNTSSKVRIEVRGGKGGDNGADNSDQQRAFGPGGGGGGGFIVYNNTNVPTSASAVGGVAGRNNATNSNADARAGGDGRAVLDTNLRLETGKDSVKRTIAILSQPVVKQVCEGESTTLNVEAEGISLKYQWFLSQGNNNTALTEGDLYGGTTSATLTVKKTSTDLNPNFYYCVITSNCAATQSATTARISLKIRTLPTAFFTADKENNTVRFKNGSSGATSYLWKFGNGKTDTVVNPVHIYAEQDSYRIVLTAKNECGMRDFSLLINLSTAPEAGFSAKTTNTCAPATLRFDNESSNNVRKFSWTFPGGNPATSSQATPSVSYATSGVYDVVLVVENSFGRDTFERKAYIRVNDKPVANFTNVRDGLKVQFTNNSTNAATYRWSFGNGDTSRAVSPQYTYKTAGTYVVRLEAINSCGTTIVTEQIVVFGLPSATVSVTRTQGCAPLIVDFAGKNVVGVSSWRWSFPGGNPATSSVANPRVTYGQPGVYDVSLTITNTAGSSSIKQDTFIRVFPTPRAIFTAETNKNIVTVTNSSIGAEKFKWNFGDGTISTERDPPPHTYTRNGNFGVTLLAENASCAAASERTINVNFFTTANGELNTDDDDLKVFPNPTDGNIWLELSQNIMPPVRVKIVHPNGQVVRDYPLSRESRQVLDLQNLPAGIYLLHCATDKKTLVRKVVKM